MSLNVKLKQLHLFKCKGEKIIKLQFRGVHYFSSALEDRGDNVITINEKFKWQIARPIENDEQIHISLYSNNNRCLNPKLIGSLSIVLQHLINVNKLSLKEVFLDYNNQQLPATIEFDMWYQIPDGESSLIGSWSDNRTLDEDQQMLLNVEQNIANLEKSLLYNRKDSWSPTIEPQVTISDFKQSSNENSPIKEKKRTTRLKNRVKSLMTFGRQRSKSSDREELIQETEDSQLLVENLNLRIASSCGDLRKISVPMENEDLMERSPQRLIKPKQTAPVTVNPLKAEDFQVCITIIEARQLAGLNMHPVVCVQVDDIKKYTSVKESTNCPYYNEYFVFDFHMPATLLFDKIITLSVLHSRKLLRSGTVVGSFKIDLRTVYDTPEHQFYHKWALLTDPDDIIGGAKGFLKCDISVIGKGDCIKIPTKVDKNDEDDIEGNLLLPDGVPLERQRARFVVRIYKADGLPKMNNAIMANVKKAFTGEIKDLVNPFVQVSFAGLTGRTSVKKHCYTPVWNEQICFSEMFPPLCQRMKIQLRDSDTVNNSVIGTHFLDLKKISNDGENGFLPTFGPSFIHLYGSTREYSLIDEHSSLNAGLGEGVSYRGKLLLSLRTEIVESFEATSEVEVESAYPLSESFYGINQEFFLFACILDATMIDRKLSEKSMFLELSIGNAGNTLDGYNESSGQDAESQDSLVSITTENESWHSITSPVKPMTHDKLYYFLPYFDDKPCMNIRSSWPDQRRRMYNSNIISKLSNHLEEGLSEVRSMMEMEQPDVERKLKCVLEDLSSGCGKYLSITRGIGSGTGIGKTRLDKERMKMCQKKMDMLGRNSRNLKALVTKNSLKERYKTAQNFLHDLQSLEEDPQHSLPDVFIWVISNKKRYAYQRIPARDILFSMVEEECGRYCSKVHTIFPKLPGKKGIGTGGWAIQIKLDIYFWFGLMKHKKHYLEGLPKGYELSNYIKNPDRAPTPITIHYAEKYNFQFRAYMYQARSLIGSDASGLSDPFARVIIGEYVKSTQVIDETLSPTWDELIVFDNILLYGSKDYLRNEPPDIIIEIFDQDRVGKSEFLGRTIAKPHIKFMEEPYEKPKFPPMLQWYDIQRGTEHAGELLAAFELLEVILYQESYDLPSLPQPKEEYLLLQFQNNDIEPLYPVPQGIRPTLATYRIEVLFWGLRDVKRIHFMSVDRPRVDIECAGNILYSSVIPDAKRNPNFSTPVKFMELELPEEELYRPPLTIRVVDCRSFGRYTLVGTHMINSVQKYMYQPPKSRDNLVYHGEPRDDLSKTDVSSNSQSPYVMTETVMDINIKSPEYSIIAHEGKHANKKIKQTSINIDDDIEDRDWWTKFFASEAAAQERVEDMKDKCLSTMKQEHSKTRASFAASKLVAKLSPKHHTERKNKTKALTSKVYLNELEAQPEFNGFKEWLLSFDLYRGKKTKEDTEDETRVVGTFKGSIKVCKWPLPKDIEDHTVMGFDPQYGFFQGLPSNDPIHVLVRVYVISASDLHPTDMNGKADPYILLQLGSKRISDKSNYVSKQLNPVFGKCFEIEATFPQDSMLTVQVLDWDLVGTDDLIGETRIDLENRFYSRHRATCGIPYRYETNGYGQWRDPMKPTQILAKLCKDVKIDPPAYLHESVKIGRQLFRMHNNNEEAKNWNDTKLAEEQMALTVLHNWHKVAKVGCRLVPEHVETRSLYKPDKAGIERGKLKMWVDLFPMDMPLPGPPIDISPRKPVSYQLRVIIWNTDDVVLEDDAFFTGEKMSDIYVKGWLKGPEDCQSTDIHYRSMTGEGNFNWRFIFPFNYLVAEGKVVTSKKQSLFSWDESENKIPARLELQVWDADHFSADDFLGALTLDLNRFPRGAKSSKLCTLKMLNSDPVPMVNLFKQKRVKGWWPFYVKRENEEMELTGKVEAELHLMTQEEAEKNPAGLGRNEPDPLDKPNRPDSSFMWFLNPVKSMRYILWHNYKWRILKALIIIGLAIMIFLFFYSIPGYTVKKLLGA